MKSHPKTFEQWVAAATDGLSRSVCQRLNLELASHYQDALDAGVAAGLSQEEAAAKALEALGEPKAAREVFRQEYCLELPWEELQLLPEKPLEHPYGFLRKNELAPCSREDLIQRCKDSPLNTFLSVWTPETDRVVPVERVPFLLEALKEDRAREAKRELYFAIGWALCATWTTADGSITGQMFAVCIVFLSLASIYSAANLFWEARGLSPSDVVRERNADAFGTWAFERIWNSFKTSRFTPALFGMWLLVAFVQFFSWVLHDDFSVSIKTTGLLRSAVLEGEWWRFATAIHISTDALAIIPTIGLLLFYGSLMEAILGPGFVPIIFLASSAAGLCLGSFFAGPATGFTAGTLGLVGWLFVTAQTDGRLRRLNHLTSFPLVITFLALASILFLEWPRTVVNLGGFAAGAALALLFSKSNPAIGTKSWFRLAGYLAGGLLLESGVAACLLIIVNR